MHHFIHLLELAGHGLDLGVQVAVLCVLVVEHGPVLVPLLIAVDAGVLPVYGDTTDDLSSSSSLPAYAGVYVTHLQTFLYLTVRRSERKSAVT